MPVDKKTFVKAHLHPLLAELPRPSETRIAMRVSQDAERVLLQGHPWLFEGAIKHQSHAGNTGDLAVIFDHQRKFLAVGLYDPYSSIRVRVLQHRLQVPIDQSWFVNRLNAAARLRAPLLNLPSKKATTGYRLVHGENDGFPGLVIDRYEETLVIKLYTLAWIPHLVDVIAALNQVVPGDRLLLRFSRALLDQANMLYSLHDGLTLFGSALDRPVLFSENGLRFEADLQHGNKTGFFFDQRDNRAQVERLAAGKRVLDVFAYSGGFSVYAARGGAQEITSIDISRAALNAALRNIQHNRAIPEVASAQHTVTAGDAFEILSQMGANGQRFDLVIIDPPAFAQKQSQISKAISAYQRLTRLGLRVLQPGGILVQASCSSRVTANEFFNSINRAAQLAGRPLNELARSGHPLDHPIRFEQGAYLKCLFAKA